MSTPPDQTQVISAIRHRTFYDAILSEVRGDLSRLVHHDRYDQQQGSASTYVSPFPTVPPAFPVLTPAPEEELMALIAELEADAEALRAKAEEFVKTKLPAATGDLKKLEGLADNPVVLSLLSAVHVPTEALPMVVKVIDSLEELYKPETAVVAPAAPAEPAAPAAPAEPAAPAAAG